MTHELAQPQRALFRQEAVDFQQHDRQWGRVVALQSLPTKLMVWFIVSAAIAAIAFLFQAHYARKETVMGYLTPAAGTAKVFAPQTGTISAIYVEQGQRVEAGQPLLSVMTSHTASNGEDVDTAVLHTLARQKEALAAQIAAQDRRVISERERLTAQRQGIENELAQLVSQVSIQQERIGLAERLVASGAPLAARGLVAEIEQRRREEALLAQRQSLGGLMQQLVSRRGQHSETAFALDQLATVMDEKIQLLRNELSSAEQRIAEVNGRRAYIIRAPIAGYVSSLQASVGQATDPQRLQLQIVPGDSALQAELFVPARAIGFVKVGQDVRILYDAFPYQHYGAYHGRIIRVSQTVLTGTDISTPVTLREPAYRAVVTLDRPDIDAFGKRIPLQPDMLLKADVILERRTLMDWILNPLLSARLQG
jgi:membrane fusion protein